MAAAASQAPRDPPVPFPQHAAHRWPRGRGGDRVVDVIRFADMLKAVPVPVWIVAGSLVSGFGTYNIGVWLAEGTSRSSFISTCLGSRWRDNEIVRQCNIAYDEHHALRKRNWRPLP